MEEIDEAFNWLVLVLGTMAAALVGSLHLYPLPSPPLTPNIEIQFMRLLFVPLIVIVISWLGAHLVQNEGMRIVLKSFSWFYALLLLLIDLLFFLGVILAMDLRATLLGPGLLWIPTLVYLGLIRRRYKLIYPDSRFLKSNILQVIASAPLQ